MIADLGCAAAAPDLCGDHAADGVKGGAVHRPEGVQSTFPGRLRLPEAISNTSVTHT